MTIRNKKQRIFQEETLFTLKVSVVLRREIVYGQQNKNNSGSKGTFHEAGHSFSLYG